MARTPDDYYVSQVNSDISLSAHANIAFHGRNEILRGTFLKAPKLRWKIETARGVQFMRHLRPTSLHPPSKKRRNGRNGEGSVAIELFNGAKKKKKKKTSKQRPTAHTILSGQDRGRDLVTSGFETGQWR